MKKRIIQSLLAIACCVTVALSAVPTAEAAMRASVVTGKVIRKYTTWPIPPDTSTAKAKKLLNVLLIFGNRSL